jgi:hypothetical protein
MLAFGIIYVFTCLLGGLVMIVGFHNFDVLYKYFSGTPVARLTGPQRLIDLNLLLSAPALLWVGYELGTRARVPRRAAAIGPRIQRYAGGGRLDTPSWLPPVVFYGLAAIALASIARSGSLRNLSSWLDYSSWIAAREEVFQRMSFFEFVNVYLLVPVAAAWVVITLRRPGVGCLLLRWFPVALTLGIDLLLYQKKTAIISLLIVMFAWVLATGASRGRRAMRGAITTGVLAVIVYLATVVAPVYSKASTASICTVPGIHCDGGSAGIPAIDAYTALAPLTRSSAPALYYPIIFPHHHAYFSVASIFAVDILGIGTFPNDNQVVWHFMNPDIPGTTMVPFQFTLFSQGGLGVALLGSLVIGFLLALAWRFVRSELLPRAWSALLGSMVLLLAVYLALDSLRNSTLVSYGMVWGVLFIGVTAVAVRFVNRPTAARRSAPLDEGGSRPVAG